MEVLSARMTPALKGEESTYYKRMYEGNNNVFSNNSNKQARKGDLKVEHRSERTGTYETASMRESSGHRKIYAGGSQGWDVGSRKFVVPRSMGRPIHPEIGSNSAGNQRRIEKAQESSDEAETSHENAHDDSEMSGDEEPARPQATEAPQKWPIIQIVDPPAWLPEGWTAVLRTRESGSKDKYYVDPVSQRRFRSKTEVNYYLQTGKSYRYKRNLALLTKPLKEDPVSLPNTVTMRSVNLDVSSSRDNSQTTLQLMSPSYAEHRGVGALQARPAQGPDMRLSVGLSGAEPMKVAQVRNKPGPKPRVRDEESGRPYLAVSKRNLGDERKAPDVPLGGENRGKLILKLKRKTSELDEGQKNGKKPRPFEVVGATPAQISRSSTSSEEDRHQKPWSMDHCAESSRMHIAPIQASRKVGKSGPVWHYPPVNQHPMGGGNGQMSNPSGSSHLLERTSGSATLSITDSENAKFLQKRESPAEQLQRLGRKLCQQAVLVLTSEYGGINTLQQINHGLGVAMNPGYYASHNLGFNPKFSGFSPSFNTGFITPAPPPAHYHQQQPIKRMRGSLPKQKSILPMQKYGLDHYMQLPQSV